MVKESKLERLKFTGSPTPDRVAGKQQSRISATLREASKQIILDPRQKTKVAAIEDLRYASLRYEQPIEFPQL